MMPVPIGNLFSNQLHRHMYNSCCCVWTMIELEQHCQRTDVFKRFNDSETKTICTCTRDYIYINIHSCL